MPKKEVTNKELANKIDDLAGNINDLALSVKQGFDGVDKRFDSVDKRFDKVENRLDDLENGHEDIKLRLTNVAYRFEFQELERRVILLEKKAGMAKARKNK